MGLTTESPQVNGGMVYIVPSRSRDDPMEITRIVKQHCITYTKTISSEYLLWLQYGSEVLRGASEWRFAFAGGETLPNAVLRGFATLGLPRLRLFNSYGPTEISISSHKLEVPLASDSALTGPIPCGYPLPIYVTYILDDQLKPVPPGMPGHVFIGGAGVSDGYLNDRALTDRAFTIDPFAADQVPHTEHDQVRMYRTGDIGHLTEDGALVFRSRVAGDTQVKIRGLRIELQDIGSTMLAAADGQLRDVVVSLRGGDMLVAHVVFAAEPPLDTETEGKAVFLERLLSRLPLPQYMVPVAAIPLDRLPLNNHSKVDRSGLQMLPLPRVEATKRDKEHSADFSETMTKLEHVW